MALAGRATSFTDLYQSQIAVLAKWLSCNGEVWGMGPTAVFASAAALFLYHELEATIFITGDHVQITALEKSLISSMVMGMLALMIHLWVCSMRLFEYYLDTLIRDSPNMLLEMTTAGLLGSPTEFVPLGPLTRFLRSQQPQIHITVCWFLSLCYADYVRKNYCQRFNLPYLEQWQTELHERASRGVQRTMEKVHSFVALVHQRLRGYAHPEQNDTHTESADAAGEQGSGGAGGVAVSRCVSKVSWSDRSDRSAPAGSPDGKEFSVRLVSQSSETTADAIERLRSLIKLYEWAKCGEGWMSVVPTMLWAMGAGLLAQRLLGELFKRFLFRRVPAWELMLQYLLFVWMVVYSLHFWVAIVSVIKWTVLYCFEDDNSTPEDVEARKVMQQWVIWMCGVSPLSIYLYTRPRPDPPPLMIWITTSPWQRREMGPYGYYLNRPLQMLQSSANLNLRRQPMMLRRAFSDSKVFVPESPKKKRHSKSV